MLTRNGWWFAVLSVAFFVAGVILSYRELIIIGLAFLACLLAAAVSILLRPDLQVKREVVPCRVNEGDAAEDWDYLALIRGRRLGSPSAWKARIAATVGVAYDEPTWRAWEAFNSVKGACVNLTALDVFARTVRPTPDLLAIGVAVHLRFLARAIDLTGPDLA